MNNTTSSGLYCWSSSSPHLPPTDHNNHNHNHHHHHVGMGMGAACPSEHCMIMSSDVHYLHPAYSPFDDASLSHSSASATFVDGCNNPLAIEDSTTTTNPRRYDEDGIISTNSSAEWFPSLEEEDSTNPKSSLSLLCSQTVSVDKYTDVMSQRNISYPYYTYNNYLNTTTTNSNNSNNSNNYTDSCLPPAQAPRTCTTPHEWFYHHVVPSPWNNTAITADAAAAATAAANPNNSMMMGAATNTVHDPLFPPFSVPFLAKSDVDSNNYEYMNVPDNNNSALPVPFCNVNNSNLNFNFNLNLNFNNNPIVVRGDKQELFDSLKEAPHLNHRKKNNKTSVKRINKQTSKPITPHTPTSTPTLASTVTNATTTSNSAMQQPIYSSATSLSALSIAEDDSNDHDLQKQQPHFAIKQERTLIEPIHNKYHSSPSVMQSDISTIHSVKKKKSALLRKRSKRSRKEMESEIGNNDMDNNNNGVEMNTNAGEATKNGTSTAPKAKKFKRVALSEPKLIRHKKFPFICEQTHLDVPLDGSTNNNNGFFRCCMALECGLLCGQTFHQKSHWARHCKKLHAYAAQ